MDNAGNLFNLDALKTETQTDIHNNFNSGDYSFSSSFKKRLSDDYSTTSDEISFCDYTTIVHNRSNQVIYIANQWFVLASYAVNYVTEIINYKKYSDEIVESMGVDKKIFYPQAKNGEKNLIELFRSSAEEFCLKKEIDSSNVQLLTKFVSDYEWWLGGKTIDRTNDYYVSPALGILNLVNASQEYVAKIVLRYINNPQLLGDIKNNPIAFFKGDSQKLANSSNNKTDYTIDELAAILKEMASDTVNTLDARIHMFAIKYAESIISNDYNKKELVHKAGLKESLSLEVGKGLHIYNLIKTNYCGITFYDSELPSNITEDDKLLTQLSEFEYFEYEPQKSEFKRNMIIHGAPGTGKSYRVEKLRKDLLTDKGEYTRVTFHPDYSYAGFVGTYKPVPVGNDSTQGISYEYVPGPFMQILVKALQNPNKPYLLIIEEINRSNTAAVFGDVFQLLDRDNTGKSMYPINVSPDMKAYLKKETGIDFSEIRIPSNMFIWATMNSADQGVFPMDTAFKRRWSFSYIGLDDSESEMEKYDVKLGNETVNWNKLRKALNDRLTDLGINEDKLFGPFFISEADMKNQEEFSDIFKDKVISYLFEDAARGKRQKLFTTSKMRYSEVCRDFDNRGTGIFNFEGMSVDFAPVNTVTGSDNE